SFAGDAREVLKKFYGRIAATGAVLGVEFLVDGRARQLYQLRAFTEFAAETYMIYTSQGGVLREFVAGLEGEAGSAWKSMYRFFRESFEGVEYE
ncbi:MAG: hypothetical protein ACYTFG_02685, partial [Planctomycetota bacterium]